MLHSVIKHAKSFANYLSLNVPKIQKVLRRWQSKQVVDDEIRRSIETLQRLPEIAHYFIDIPLSQKTAAFLPLNLPLYSFVLFGAMPAYQSHSLVLRSPSIMHQLFSELFDTLALEEHYPNVKLFRGSSREQFISEHCKDSSVVLFTGRYENFLHVKEACRSSTLILYNGAGHNPIIVTPSADLDLAVEKTIYARLFNNGQDCAGPDSILVHNLVIDAFVAKLYAKLSQIKCGVSYEEDDTIVGPMFEPSSLPHVLSLVSDMQRQGAVISYGGQIDIKHNLVYPCVIRAPLQQVQNFTEIYTPLFVLIGYDHDYELTLYLSDPDSRYQNSEMYISMFGQSDCVSKTRGSIVLVDHNIHDVEIGIHEYGGYSPRASSVSFRGLCIPKPILIPREIYRFLSTHGQRIFSNLPSIKGEWEQQIVATQFQETVRRIFDDKLVFAYIFGSFASEKDKRHSDIDTFICVTEKDPKAAEEYLEWLFTIHEMFGRIPDFMYPTEIVTLNELNEAIKRLQSIELSAQQNDAAAYDAMVWCHSLSQAWIGTVNPERVCELWKQLFTIQCPRLLRSFLDSLEKYAFTDANKLCPATYEIPRKEPEISHFISNLKDRGLINVLKMIPFEDKPVHTDIILKLIAHREFIGRDLFLKNTPEHLYSPYFRFGVVVSPTK